MHFLQSHLAMLHHTAPNVVTSNSWHPHVPLNTSTELHLHHETISHPARNAWGCSGISCHPRSPTLHHASSSMSTCLHLCCSDRERTTAHRLQSQHGPFQTPRETPGSPYMTQSHTLPGQSLLGVSSGFSSFPVICQASQVAYNAQIPAKHSSQPLCTPNCGHSHPSFSAPPNCNVTQNLPQSHTPIHPPIPSTVKLQYHTVVDSLTPTGILNSVSSEEKKGPYPSPSYGPRQNDLVGSSPVHPPQECSNKACRGSVFQERTDNAENHGTSEEEEFPH